MKVNKLQKSIVKEKIESLTNDIFDFLMNIKNALPDNSQRFVVIKHLNTKKCMLKSELDKYDNLRPQLGYMENKLLSTFKNKISLAKIKQNFGYDHEIKGMLTQLELLKYVYIDKLKGMVYRISDDSYSFLMQEEKMFFFDELKLLKEWELGFATMKFYLSFPQDDYCGEILFSIDFRNILNLVPFAKLNNFNYDKYNEKYKLYLLGFLPMSDIEFRKNIKIMLYSLYLTRMYDDTEMRFHLLPPELIFKEFYKFINDIQPFAEDFYPLWKKDYVRTNVELPQFIE